MILLISGLPGCKPDISQTAVKGQYVDLKAFFKQDSAYLNHHHATLTKTVRHNESDDQTLTLSKVNWALEFSLFIESDINKPAWRDGYEVIIAADSIVYQAKLPELKTRKIVLKKRGEKVKQLVIDNYTKNLLYETSERLSYYTDSVYIVQKTQKIIFLGANRYYIKGNLFMVPNSTGHLLF